MPASTRKKFMVLYTVPGQVMAEWAQTEPATRKAAEEKMQSEWRTWMEKYGNALSITEAAGKTKAVTLGGVSDTKNDIMLYSVVEAESHEAAVRMFASHPHLTIPQSSIQVMEVRALGPMQ
jgi:hypothetical protein